MMMQTIQNRFLTATPSPDLELQKRQAQAAQAAKLSAAYGGTGSGGGASVPSFDAYLREANAYYTPETIDYTPLDAETVRSMLAKWLRPSYDEAIDRRRERTAVYNANLDADAWARGMGASSFVTDVKGRNYGDESRDVRAIETAYGSTLAQHLLDALNKQVETKLEVDRFNAEQINEARARAYSAATSLYQAALAAAQSAKKSGGSSAKRTTTAKTMPAITMKTALKNSLKSAPVYDRIQTTTPETVENVLSRLSTSERGKLYSGKTKSAAKTLAEMTKTVGSAVMQKLMRQFAAN